MNSLERSLQIGLVVSLLVVLFVFWWSISLTSQLLTANYMYSQIERRAYAVQSLIEAHGSSVGGLLSAQVSEYPDHSIIVASDNAIWTAPAGQRLAEPPVLVPGQSVRRQESGADKTPVLAWYGGFSINGERYVIGVRQNMQSIVAKLQVFHWFAAVLAITLLLVLLVVQKVIIGRSVQALERIRSDMLRLERGHAVALSEDVPSEVMPLVVEFNQLLRRFEQRLRQSRNAVGNLAHSLKAPLNLLIRSSHAETIDNQARTLIGQNAEHIRVLIDSELKRARLAGRGGVGTRFDVDAELPAMIGLLEQVYSDKAVTVDYENLGNVELVYDRQDMLELIGNLLDNAVKWCTGYVVLTMRSNEGITIDVEDDGPGCSPELLGQLTGRGVRLDESVSGHGLGLSIVKDIVDTYNGRLLLEKSPELGGLKASVFLPQQR